MSNHDDDNRTESDHTAVHRTGTDDSGTGDTGTTPQGDRTERIERVESTTVLPTTASAQPTGTTETTASTETTEPTERTAFWDPTGQPAPAAYAPQDERPAAPTGPHLPAIVLGLLALVVAGLAIADSLLSFDIDWNVTGPIGIVVVGGALVLLGVLGLAGNRRRS